MARRSSRDRLTPPAIGAPPEIGSPPPIPKPPKVGRPAAIVPPHWTEEPAPDALASVVYSGDPETDAKAELNAVAAGFRARNKADRRRMQNALDSEYFTVLTFADRDQRAAFLAALGIDHLGARYLDGRKVAAALGITLPEPAVGGYTAANPEKSTAALVMARGDSEVPPDG